MRSVNSALQENWQEFYYSSISKDKTFIYVSTIFLSPEKEICIFLKVDSSHLIIEQAFLESIGRFAKNGKAERSALTELIGMKAFPEANRYIFQLSSMTSRLKILLNDSFNSIIQGEAYFFRERGFQTKQEYDNYCMQTYNINCRFSGERLKEGPTWMEYVGSYVRQNILYNKFKHITLTKNMICGFMSDSFHEMNANLKYQIDQTVTDSVIQILRAPGKACFENEMHHINLIGKKIGSLDYKFLKNAVGGKKGCFHLLDLLQCMDLAISEKNI